MAVTLLRVTAWAAGFGALGNAEMIWRNVGQRNESLITLKNTGLF